MATSASGDDEEVTETVSLAQLKVELSNHWQPIPSDRVLLAYLRAAQGDIGFAEKLHARMLPWRQENHIDTIIGDFSFPEHIVTQQLYPQFYHKTDKSGRPIYVEMLGKVDLSALSEAVTPNNSIADLPDSIFDLIEQLSLVVRNYYPEMLGDVYVINAPTEFDTFWSKIVSRLDPLILDNVTVLRGGASEELLSIIEPEHLPKSLGGGCECPGGCDVADAGPWNAGDGEPSPTIADDVIQSFKEILEKTTANWLIMSFSTDWTQVVVEQMGDSVDYAEFTKAFPADDCRFGVFRMGWDTVGAGPTSRLILFFWIPPTAKPKSKLMSQAMKSRVLGALSGIFMMFECTDMANVSYDSVLKQVKAFSAETAASASAGAKNCMDHLSVQDLVAYRSANGGRGIGEVISVFVTDTVNELLEIYAKKFINQCLVSDEKKENIDFGQIAIGSVVDGLSLRKLGIPVVSMRNSMSDLSFLLQSTKWAVVTGQELQIIDDRLPSKSALAVVTICDVLTYLTRSCYISENYREIPFPKFPVQQESPDRPLSRGGPSGTGGRASQDVDPLSSLGGLGGVLGGAPSHAGGSLSEDVDTLNVPGGLSGLLGGLGGMPGGALSAPSGGVGGTDVEEDGTGGGAKGKAPAGRIGGSDDGRVDEELRGRTSSRGRGTSQRPPRAPKQIPPPSRSSSRLQERQKKKDEEAAAAAEEERRAADEAAAAAAVAAEAEKGVGKSGGRGRGRSRSGGGRKRGGGGGGEGVQVHYHGVETWLTPSVAPLMKQAPWACIDITKEELPELLELALLSQFRRLGDTFTSNPVVQSVASRIDSEISANSKTGTDIADIFCRLNECSLKGRQDGVPIPLRNGLDIVRCMLEDQRVYLWFTTSKITQTSLYLSDWDPYIDMQYEYRVFVYQGHVTGISQYRWAHFYGAVSEMDGKVIGLQIVDFIDGRLLPALGAADGEANTFVADILCRDGRVWLIEINKFGGETGCGSALFHWKRDEDILYGDGKAVVIRFLSEG
ncbi:cytosolic factor, phosphatidylinositol/phosphatidylcholine transfer protein [Rhizophlyctis rosea]|nr:cytosolic factor, phosphatidylinositol/phosphatidylcholine transfer protein [Rhizophlyctis rosea]